MTSKAQRPSKPCAACGRTIEWRKKWERDWDSVRYCSERCRRTRADPAGPAIEAAILELLQGRPGATICPSEAARAVGGESWRDLMESVRHAANRMAAEGRIEVRQRGRAVDPSTARGPIRLRLASGAR